MNNILTIANLTKIYTKNKAALLDCSFTMQSGNICAVVGESGSGKTTLLRLIAGLERPDAGSIKINEALVSDMDHIVQPQDRQVGMVFQDFSLFPHLTVEQNIAFGVTSNKKATVKKLLQTVQMSGYEKAYPAQLSGGQEQRIAIARTLATYPQLLLLDEPFSNLDSDLKSSLRNQIKSIAKQLSISLVFITHDIMDAIDIADDILLLKNGKAISYSSIEQFAKGDQIKEVRETLDQLRDQSQQIVNFLQ